MKKRIVIVCAAAFFAVGIVFPSGYTRAETYDSTIFSAKCAIPSFRQAFQKSANVFVGKVISESKKGDYRIFQFEAAKYWKGAKTKKITVEVYETPRFQAWFEVGGEYLIFAEQNEGKLQVSRCSRSKELSDAKDDLKLLGKGKKSK